MMWLGIDSQKRGIMKAMIYKGFTYVHCLFVVAGIGVEDSFLFFDKPKKEICCFIITSVPFSMIKKNGYG
jgi:hypothetical protein